MKKINSSLCSIFMLLVCAFSVQSVFAVDVPLKKSGEQGPPNQITSLMMTRSIYINPVSASLNDTEFVIDFSNSVGTARISVEDQNGNAVYQDVVNTDSNAEIVIPTDTWDSGNYTVRISYGSTKLTGTFQF